MHEVDQPPGPNQSDIGRGSACDVSGEALLQIVPLHHLDLDVDIGMDGSEILRHSFEYPLSSSAVKADHHSNLIFRLRRCDGERQSGEADN